MKQPTIFILAILIMTALGTHVGAQGKPENPCGEKTGSVFHVNDPMNRNTVSFESTAPLEDITGISNQITGQLVFDPQNPEKGGMGELSIPIKSLNTGIPLRNEHLAGQDWLNSEKYPNITFKITEVRNLSKVNATADAQTYDVTVVGDLTLHGVTKHLQVPGRITYLKESETTKQKLPGNLLAARTEFIVSLADFGITGPKGMGLIGSKVGENVKINFSVIGSSQSASMTQNPCNPCGGKKPQNPCNPCGEKKDKKAGNPCGSK